MNEAITLVMSVGIIYWIFSHQLYNTHSVFLKITAITGLVIALFSIINGFLNIHLTKSLRLFLSIWSYVIMTLLAVENIYLVYQDKQIEDTLYMTDKTFIALKYFLLGVSSIYILQNVWMLIQFFPSKNRFFNKEYFEDLRELKREHIIGYSDYQSNVIVSSLFLILSAGFYLLNYKFHFLPVNTAIWLVFFVLNNAVYLYGNKN